MTEFVDLSEAVRGHVRPGDAIHVVLGHSRWTALVRETARQFWGTDPRFTLVMASLGSLSALLFRGGCLTKVVTAYSGDSFPSYTPNPIYQEAYRSGRVAVEHWSFLSYIQRLEAAAAGLPAAVTGSLGGSSMAANGAFAEVETPFGRVGLVAPLVPDVTLVHAAVADTAGNVAMAAPRLEGVPGAYAARRGVLATVERVVDDLRPWSGSVVIPAHRVLAVVEAPFGAHPGGLHVGPPGHAAALPAEPYGEDIPFWSEAAAAARGGTFDAWAVAWCRDVDSHDTYLRKLGPARLADLRERSSPDSWHTDDKTFPVDETAPPSDWERAAVVAARELAERLVTTGTQALLAGAGVANLAAWAAVSQARAAGADVVLTGELGMWGYEPTPADPFIFNFRSFPSATMLADTAHVLGRVMSGPGTQSMACIGCAQFDRHGNLNTTDIPGGPFLVGSGGANDVASSADEVLVVTLLRPGRAVEHVGYVTSPGERVRTVVTDKGVLRKDGGELVLVSVPDGQRPVEERVRDAREASGWPLAVARDVAVTDAPLPSEVIAMRNYDRRRWFLGG